MVMSDEVKKKMNEYVERFEDAVPVMQLQGLSNEDIIKLIDEALETGKKIDTKFNNEEHYS